MPMYECMYIMYLIKISMEEKNSYVQYLTMDYEIKTWCTLQLCGLNQKFPCFNFNDFDTHTSTRAHRVTDGPNFHTNRRAYILNTH